MKSLPIQCQGEFDLVDFHIGDGKELFEQMTGFCSALLPRRRMNEKSANSLCVREREREKNQQKKFGQVRIHTQGK